MKASGLLSLLGVLGVAAVVAASNSRAIGSTDRTKGTYVGQFVTLHHKVSGHLYAVDNITVYIEDFTYDGEAPDAYFFAGKNTATPSHRGFIIPNEKGNKEVLGPYARKNMFLKFPITKKGQRYLGEVKWISVWCRDFGIDFGHVLIPSGIYIPKRQVATGFRSDKPLVFSSTVSLEDTKTIQLDDFSFDGTVQDAIFVMGSGDATNSGVQVKNERGSTAPLDKYSHKTLQLTVPPEVRGEPIQYLGVWSPTKGMLASVTFDPDAPVPPAMSDIL